MDGYADDLAAVIEALDLKDITMVGHSTGGGEVARYIGRYGTKRLAKAVLIAAVPPIMLKSAANPERTAHRVFDGLRSLAGQGPLAGLQRLRSPVLWRQPAWCAGVARHAGSVLALEHAGGLKNAYDSIKAFSETDFTEDLKKFDIPTLVMHGRTTRSCRSRSRGRSQQS
jgi:non-heme chloroperoxidase